MKLQGKIKAIPVKEVTEGMQVLVQGLIMKIDKVFDKNNPIIIGRNGKGDLVHRSIHISFIQTLVVEYDDTHYESHSSPIIKQLPLKYSQWQAAIDNNEVDRDKVVTFEFMHSHHSKNEAQRQGSYNIVTYVKIIPEKKLMVEYESALGVGDGSGKLLVYGCDEAIFIVQKKLHTLELLQRCIPDTIKFIEEHQKS